MEHQKKRPRLDPVLEHCVAPPTPVKVQARPSRYKPHKYGSSRSSKLEQPCKWIMSPLSFFVKLRDRYIKVMNDMAMGADFTAVTGYHSWAEFDYTLQRCNTAAERHMDALQKESTSMRHSKSQARQL